MKIIIEIFKMPFTFILWTYDETKKRCPDHPVRIWMLFGLSNLVFLIIILEIVCNFKEALQFLMGLF